MDPVLDVACERAALMNPCITLAQLSGELVTCEARDSSGSNLSLLNGGCPAKSKLSLKVGAQVMLLRNIDVAHGLCNGSRGIVTKFSKTLKHPEVLFANGVRSSP